jgi:plasmid stability protein
MRTTLDLPDHLLTEIKIRAAKEQRKIKDVIAEVLEKGLRSSTRKTKTTKAFKIKPLFNAPFPKSLNGVNFNHLNDLLETDEQLNELTQ